ncbi:MAG: hypothetical protein HRU29_01730 [Rhizobiales bacterium]|nr:hypothetical protein [Hyphomicrobiales bacterium]NRB13095.1 hypothetical protein [Hyphomicrobiales bacterium]
MAKLTNEQELADIYEVLMAWAKGESVTEARFSDRFVSYRIMDHNHLVNMYKRIWAKCDAAAQAEFDIDMFNGPQRGAPKRRINVF